MGDIEYEPAAEKFCPRCKRKRPGSDFWRNRNHWTGLQSACRECLTKNNRPYISDADRKALFAQGLQRCVKCQETKTIEEFYTSKNNKVSGRQSYCIQCCSWRKTEPTDNRRYHLKNMFGITPEDYDRMFKEQDGRCAVCGTQRNMSDDRRFSVDHNHTTGHVRGLLCNKCNVALGSADDSPDRLIELACYLIRTEVVDERSRI